jgi:glycosyltransferase involved in cell wall biosynthesis
MKISLCMICGNEESIILRCLESAKEAFDELCLVSAVGNRPADKTLYRAEKWCAENGKMFHAEHYRNTHDLPHVDDFGSARNLSFSLATGDWLLWLDCDDYLDAINCARIREAVKVCDPEHNAIFATYKVEKQGAEILRERLIRRGKGRWKSPIHETCVIEGPAVECQQLVVYHSDHKPKNESSALRNATILQASLADAARHYFYLHADLKL